MSKESNKELATRVLELVGGKKNIIQVVHCTTRLRFNLKDESKANTLKLNNDPDIIQIVQSGGQYQLVIGAHVEDVYRELMKISGFEENHVEDNFRNKRLIDRFIDIVSSVFTPFLGALAGVGVLKGLLSLLVVLGVISEQTGTYQILNAASDGFMQFIPFALAFTSAKKFKTDPFIALAVTGALLYPAITEIAKAQTPLDFLGIPVLLGQDGYLQTVIPIILTILLQSYVERLAKKIAPDFFKTVLVPLITIIVMVPVAFVLIGPLGMMVGTVVEKVYSVTFGFSPLLAGAIMGGLWQVFVMFGVHWGIAPLILLNLSMNGYDTLAPMLVAAILAQAGASLSVAIKTKSQKRKALALSGTLTAIFGITEPTVYGVTLPLKKPFYAACFGGAIGGAIIGGAGVKSFNSGFPSLLSIPGFISSIDGVESNVFIGIIGMSMAFIFSFILTFLSRFDDESNLEEVVNEVKDVKMKKREILFSPLTGKIVLMSDVPDAVFASEALGKGLAIEPTLGELRAPASGTVTTVFKTGHAIGLTTESGIEVLMHIGINTVELSGDGFEKWVKQGDQVSVGDVLVTFDITKIKEAGKSMVTPIIIMNSDNYLDVLDFNQTEVTTGDQLLTILK